MTGSDGGRDWGRDVPAALLAHPGVAAVDLIGSRARGEATEASDWDFRVTVADGADVAAVRAALPGLVAPLDPVATLWDPLSDHHVLALVLDGAPGWPVKVDLLLEQPHDREPPWQPSPANLQEVDTHFWDWTLWLAGKQHAGRHELVATELDLMFRHLLAPLGVGAAPTDLAGALAAYRAARADAEARFGVGVDRRLEDVVGPAVEKVAGRSTP